MDEARRPLGSDLSEESAMQEAPERRQWQTPSGEQITPDGLTTLLSVYAGQVSTYATLVWQAPALSLTGQSFLMMIVLGDSRRGRSSRPRRCPWSSRTQRSCSCSITVGVRSATRRWRAG